MSDAAFAPEVLVWTDELRAGQARRILEVMGPVIRVIGVGGPRSAEVAGLARQLECPCEDDLRKMLVERPAAFLLFACAVDLTRDHAARAQEHGTIILALEPVAAGLDQLPAARPGVRRQAPAAENASPAAAPFQSPCILCVPHLLRCPGYLHAADPTDTLGQPQSLCVAAAGPATQASLFARLLDAWLSLLTLADLPETIDASVSGPALPGGAGLRALTGHLAAHARLSDGRNAVLHVSDSAGQSSRALHILAGQGELRVSDADYELRDRAGRVVDRHVAGEAYPGLAELVAAQWSSVLDRPAAAAGAIAIPPDRHAAALACCLACALSCRTGQPESPGQILDMQP